MNFDGFGHSNLKTDQRTLFSLQNFLHLQKSRGTEVLFFLDVNILGNYKYLFRELGVAWKWSNKLSVHLVFYKNDFPKAAALCSISGTIIYKMCGYSFDSHCLEKIMGILLMGFSILLST